MKRILLLFLSLSLLLSGCSASSYQEAPEAEELTAQAVLDAYRNAAQVYDWFDLNSIPTGAEAIQTDEGIYYPVEEPGIETLADLETRVRACFTPALAEEILTRGSNYRDIDGHLYCASGARGQNLYLLSKTITAEQTAEDHWTVTLTFWADFTDSVQTPIPGTEDIFPTPVATTGYSQTVLDYQKTETGWRFTNFCSSDGLDLDADTVYTFDYEQALSDGSYRDYSDWQLACYLIHSDGAYTEAPSDLLTRRFLERPEDILKVLTVLDQSPYHAKYPHIDAIVAGPGYSAANGYREDRTDFQEILDTLHPEDPAEQAVLEKIRTAYDSAASGYEESPIETEFSLIVPGEKRVLTLGTQEGTFPWGYDLSGTVTYTGSGDTYGTVYEVDCGDLHLAYSVNPDDGTEYLFRLSTTVPYDRSEGYLCTTRGLYCGYDTQHLMEIYSHAVQLDAFQSDTYDACYVYEPGGDAGCKHIAFFTQDGVVAKIHLEDLRDSRLLN